jgi:hypothetical protein
MKAFRRDEYTPMFPQFERGYSGISRRNLPRPLLVGVVAATTLCGPLIVKTGRFRRQPPVLL